MPVLKEGFTLLYAQQPFQCGAQISTKNARMFRNAPTRLDVATVRSPCNGDAGVTKVAAYLPK